MEVTIVTTKAERDEMKRTLNDYADLKVSRKEFHEKYPRKVWIDTEACSDNCRDILQFLMVDNREGDCFVESFDTLDGAILYATGVYMTTEHQEDWDYMGAVKDGGDILPRLNRSARSVTVEGDHIVIEDS